MATTVYALLVGINDYPIDHHKLSGCLNDVQAIETYLTQRFQNDPNHQLKLSILTDQQATRQGVIDGFEHFAKAKKGDVCLFYYTGHGSRSTSPKEFMHIDIDGMNESLVCYDSRLEGGRDLLDKELSYLIWKYTHQKDVHFLAMFDCCHAGNNTKDVNMKPRMAERNLTPLKLESLLGFSEYKKGGTNEAPTYTPPRGIHVAFAAARANETAKETQINGVQRGIFTYNLIEVLEQLGGKVSYRELVSSLKVRIANRVGGQTPQLDASRKEDENALFLNGALPAQASHYTINYNQKLDSWVIDAGEIHGIPLKPGSDVEISVLDEAWKPSIDKVHASFCTLSGMEKATDQNKVFKASIHNLPIQKMTLGVHPDSEEAGNKVVLAEAKKGKFEYMEVVDSSNADFLIMAQDGQYRMILPGDVRPLFKRVDKYEAATAMRFLALCDQVCQWHKSLEVSNPKSGIKEDDVEIKLYQLDKPSLYLGDDETASEINWREECVYRYGYDDNAESEDEKWLYPGLRMQLTNKSKRRYYVSSLYFDAKFGITNRYMSMVMLDPGQSTWMTYTPESPDEEYYENRTLGLNIYPELLSWGVSEMTEHIKVFVSKKELDTSTYNLKALEMDTMQINKEKVVGRRPKNSRTDDWRTFDIELKISRPHTRVQLQSKQAAQLTSDLQIELPEGMTATASLTAMSDVARLESARSIEEPYKMPSDLSNTESMSLTKGGAKGEPASVLELSNVSGLDKVDSDHPLQLKMKTELKANEAVLPIGYDPETGMYYPLGPISRDGDMQIETLPDPSPDGQKSLGGSLKIFFQKTILPYLGYEYTYPQLAIPAFAKNDQGEQVVTDYNIDTAQIKTKVAEANKILLYIHGIIGSTKEMAPSAYLLKDESGKTAADHFDLILTYDYENLNTSITDTGKKLGERLAAVGLGPDHGKELIIVAHSMGGLVSRCFIENEGGNKVVSHLIQVGTPNAGTPWTSVYEMAMTLLTRAINGASFLQPYLTPLSFIGKVMDKVTITLKQMKLESDFITGLNDSTDPGIPYSIVIGNTRLISTKYDEKQQSLIKRMLARFKQRGLYDALDLAVFRAANDIAVSTKSIADIAGKENRQFPPKEYTTACDHISYFVDPNGVKDLSQALFDTQKQQ